MGNDSATSAHEVWARFRFSVIGPLLASPPKKGELGETLKLLSATVWKHPITGEPVTFAWKTIEEWFYRARKEDRDPVQALRRAVRKDAGTSSALSDELKTNLLKQYRQHKSWSYQLHYDNLEALVKGDPTLGPLPSYATLRRFLTGRGLTPIKRKKGEERPGEARARKVREQREIRSYEAEYVGGLWHFDFHESNFIRILLPDGEWAKPFLLGILDDRSRLACHLQWYLHETARDLCHGLSQGFQKRGIPREILSDNGSAMIAGETTEGLRRLGILHDTTLEYSPHQNGKQERFFGTVEGRLMAMLEGVDRLTLDLLNEATQAWYEMDYHRSVHSETHQTPLDRFLTGPDVLRPCPQSEEFRNAFRIAVTRSQRRGDGTITLDGVRFEVPSRFRHFRRLTVHYARWNLGNVHLIDTRSSALLSAISPVDKSKNAEGIRRPIKTEPPIEPEPSSGIAPFLRKLMADYSATGLPPAYLPQSPKEES